MWLLKVNLTLDNSRCYNLPLGGGNIYAIVDIGGKQYKVAPHQTIQVDRLGIEKGETVELGKVLLVGEDGATLVGAPFVEGAKVIATSLGEVKGEKVTVFKYKAKVRYRRKKGHRQLYSRILINEIVAPGQRSGGASL